MGFPNTYSSSEHGVVLELKTVQAPEDGCTGGLDTLVETGHVGGLTAGVGEGTHVPRSLELANCASVFL